MRMKIEIGYSGLGTCTFLCVFVDNMTTIFYKYENRTLWQLNSTKD